MNAWLYLLGCCFFCWDTFVLFPPHFLPMRQDGTPVSLILRPQHVSASASFCMSAFNHMQLNPLNKSTPLGGTPFWTLGFGFWIRALFNSFLPFPPPVSRQKGGGLRFGPFYLVPEGGLLFGHQLNKGTVPLLRGRGLIRPLRLV